MTKIYFLRWTSGMYEIKTLIPAYNNALSLQIKLFLRGSIFLLMNKKMTNFSYSYKNNIYSSMNK